MAMNLWFLPVKDTSTRLSVVMRDGELKYEEIQREGLDKGRKEKGVKASYGTGRHYHRQEIARRGLRSI